jgi:hypothetical protein
MQAKTVLYTAGTATLVCGKVGIIRFSKKNDGIILQATYGYNKPPEHMPETANRYVGIK